jgi:hypothetical protein
MVNAAASLPTGSDPICGTCDIQATVRAPRRINIGRLLEASRRRRANLPFGFCSHVRRACNSIADEATAAPSLPRFVRAIVIACEENLSRGGLARLLACLHLN